MFARDNSYCEHSQKSSSRNRKINTLYSKELNIIHLGKTIRCAFIFLAIFCLNNLAFSDEKLALNYHLNRLNVNLHSLSGSIGFEHFNFMAGLFRSDFKTQEFAIHTDQDSMIAEN